MDRGIESLVAAIFKQAIKDIKKYPEQKDAIISELKNFTIVRLDANSDDEIIDVDGNKLVLRDIMGDERVVEGHILMVDLANSIVKLCCED